MPPAPTPWTRKPGRRQARAVKHDAVRAAAARLFSRKGYHNVSLDDIAKTLRVTKPTLYYYVGNKEELLAECFREGLDQLEGAFADCDADATGRDRLVTYLRRYGAIMATDVGRCTARIQDAELGPRMRRRIARLKATVDRRIRDLIAAGIEDGSIARLDPAMTAFAVAGALNWIGHWYDDRGRLPIDTILDRFLSLFVSGLRPRHEGPGETGGAGADRSGR